MVTEIRPKGLAKRGAAKNQSAGTRDSMAAKRARNASAVTDNVAVTKRRTIPEPIRQALWGRSAGRCAFRGCNRVLWKSDVTQEPRIVGEHAHIRAFSLGGPRAESELLADRALLHSVDNLMLLCPGCHKTVDKNDGPERYTAQVLQQMKLAHEARIELATEVAPSMASHVAVYQAEIGRQRPAPAFADCRNALFPHRYPAADSTIDLGTPKSPYADRSAQYWTFERDQLERDFDRRVRQPLDRGEIEHLSIFALAPQPLLIDLGGRLGDITQVDVFQLHREPPGWGWPMDGDTLEFIVERPGGPAERVALVLAVSGTIVDDRIIAVLGPDVAIWRVTIATPHNESVKSRATLRRFRETVRRVLDDMKALHGADRTVHVFPALPASLAVELGRVRTPKADMAWQLYDEQRELGGFQSAFPL